MFKREMKYNLKSFIIWTLILIGIYLVVYLVYPYIITDETIKSLDDVVNSMSPEMLKAFNMDISSISTAYGWLKSEGFIFVLLIIGSFSSIIGSNILLKEESDKTIEYLNSLPVKRTNIVINKFFVGFIYITLITLVLGIFNYIGLSFSGDFDKKQYILISITPLFSSYVLYSLCMFISTFTKKTKQMLGISLGITFISYILSTISEIADNVEFLKYASVFTLSDLRHVISDVAINPVMIFITVILTIFFTIITIIRYERKDLVC